LEGADPLSAAKADYKTMLQERLQAERRTAPRYTVIETLGPPHQRIFHVEVSWDGGSIRGTGPSIKAAEAAAAKAALEGMRFLEDSHATADEVES
jgi:ribonuclease-3